MLKQLHLPLLEVAPASDFEQIRAMTRDVARVLGAAAAGEELIAKMDLTLQELAATRPQKLIRVAAWGEGGSVPGPGTLFDTILRTAGGINIAASAGVAPYSAFGVEQLLAAQPDVLAYASNITDTPGAQHRLGAASLGA